MTYPASYCETCDTFRAADASAIGTGLRSVSLVNLDTYGLPSGSLVPQHVAERRPAGIEHGFSHPRLGKLGGIHVADSDQVVFTSQSCAGDVELVLPGVCDLGVDRPDAELVAGSLSLGELCFVLPVMAKRRDLGSVAARGERFEPEIYADLTEPGREGVLNLALECDVPASAGILNEGAGLECAVDVPRLPEPEAALEVDGGIAINLYGARDERNPSERPFCAEAGPEARTAAMRIARSDELPADRLNSIGMQTEFSGASGAEFNQVECCRPADIAASLSARRLRSMCSQFSALLMQ